MTKSKYLRLAMNTYSPALLVLKARGYKIGVDLSDNGEEFPEWTAEKSGKHVSATCPVTLLGLVALYEARGEEWGLQPGEPHLYQELTKAKG